MKLDSSNPMFVSMRNSHVHSNSHMTVEGTSQKALFMLVLVFASAFFSVFNESVFNIVSALLLPIILVALVTAIITVFKPKIAFFTAPIYSILMGSLAGVISFIYEIFMPGIIIQALLLTLGIFSVMFILYSNRILKATPMFTKIIVGATFAIMLTYLVSIFGSFIGFNIPYIHSNGIIGIGFSLFVVGIAAMNLILDFNFIEKGANNKLAKHFEWYGAFALIVTLIWLYLEILRLLSKLRSR